MYTTTISASRIQRPLFGAFLALFPPEAERSACPGFATAARRLLLFLAMLLLLALSAGRAAAATVQAASASLNDVQAAVDSAQNGDTVLIPNGSATWTAGIDTTKQITIRAQNYTPSPAGTAGAGATSRSVTITNNSSEPLFSFTTGNGFHCQLSGIAFREGTGTGAYISVSGSGTKVMRVNDIHMTVNERYWPVQPPIAWTALGGVMWNIVADATATASSVGGVGTFGGGLLIKSPRAWNTPSTMGSLDADGSTNVYLEDSSIINCGSWPDVDDNGRYVTRHCLLDGTWGITHGFTSPTGGRHFEYYDNTFSVLHSNRNIAGRYFWCRAGTGVFTDNLVNNASNPSEWGSPAQLDIGDNTSPTAYPQPRQPGWGHNGTSSVIDPIYIWNQTGPRAYIWGTHSEWTDRVQANRDIFVNNGAKPGYAKYTYPHPLRTGASTPPPSTVAPSLAAQPQSATVAVGQTATFSVSASGTPAPAYQWQRNGTVISGATAASYTTSATTSGDNGATFRCIVSNSAGTVTSNSATLTVTSATSGEILPADRRIVWQGNVGVAGGIPNLSTIYTTLTPSDSNDLSQIQNALRNCPANQVVKLAAGTFVLNGTLDYQTVGDGKVLRGSGRGATTMRWDSAGWPGCIAMRASYSDAAVQTGVDLASDAVKGANTLTLSSVPSWIKPGHLYLIDQLDDPGFVTRGTTAIFENGTDYRYQFVTTAYGNRGLTQTVRVTAVSGSTVTLEVPLYYGFQKSRSARFWKSGYDPVTSAPRSRCGIEDLTIRCGFTSSDAHTIKMENCDSCWIRNIESDTVPGPSHVFAIFSYRCEIRDSYFHDSRLYGPGQAYGISLFNSSCANLIENNVCKGLHASIQLNYGSSGNVVGYNYALQGRADSGNDPSISFHGTHAYMNLCEGNYCQMPVEGDIVHGSSSHNVLFRNRIEGVRSGSDNDETPVEFDYYNRKCSVVGNVLGVTGLHTIYEKANGASGDSSQHVIYKLGYLNPWGCDARLFDTLNVNTTLRHLNWDAVSNRVVADPGIAVTTLPTSYYLATKPAWFGDRPWPTFDPANPAGAVVTALPAGYRYVNGANPPTGGGPIPVAPTLTTQPQNATVAAGQSATFSVSANGTPAPSYQWQRNATAISGATAANYTIPTTVAADSGAAFRCVVSNSAGSVTSNAATLTVNTATVPVGTGTGLAAIYFDNQDFTGATVQRTDPTVNFTWGSGSPASSIAVNTFSARWQGQVQAQHSQTYTFFVTGDDGVRLRVNGQLLVDQWKDQGASEYSGSIALTAGQKYDLVLEYYENTGDAVAKLAWSSASTTKQIIPQSQLYPAATTGPILPTGWVARDIGSVGLAGATTYASGTFTVTGSGDDIWNGTDAFRFASQTLSGDGSIVARVVSVQNTDGWAKAGVMVREGTAAGAKHAFCCVTAGNGVAFQRRTATNGGSSHTAGSLSTAPRWVKLVRLGATLTGYESADGTTWTVVGSETISLTNPVQIGLAVTSHNNGMTCTAVFDRVLVTPGGSG